VLSRVIAKNIGDVFLRHSVERMLNHIVVLDACLNCLWLSVIYYVFWIYFVTIDLKISTTCCIICVLAGVSLVYSLFIVCVCVCILCVFVFFMCIHVCVCSREPISVGSYVCTRPTLQGPVALLGPDLRPNRVFH